MTTPTKWGDRVGRRRDILQAARAQLAAGGYLALSMREIAKGAGVSPATLYSYFATKEEIFAILYNEGLELHLEQVVELGTAPESLEQFLYEHTLRYAELYRVYGRYYNLVAVVADAEHPLDQAVAESLRAVTLRLAGVIASGMRRGAAADGWDLPREPLLLPYVWSQLIGICDHFSTGRHELHPYGLEELARFSARATAAGLRALAGS